MKKSRKPSKRPATRVMHDKPDKGVLIMVDGRFFHPWGSLAAHIRRAFEEALATATA